MRIPYIVCTRSPHRTASNTARYISINIVTFDTKDFPIGTGFTDSYF